MSRVVISILTLTLTFHPAEAVTQTRGAYEDVPDLAYIAVADPFELPAEVTLGPSSSVAIDHEGSLYVFHRGPNPLVRFDRQGRFVHAFGDDLGFERPHGLRIDEDGNLWVTDVRAHFVMKLSPEGEVLLTLGVRGRGGLWDEASGSRYLSEPNDIAFGPDGEIFVAQGHGNGEPGVLKFDRNGRFLTSWGRQGMEIGEFDIAHSIVVDWRSQVHVADRENQRVQVFDLDGNFIRQSSYAGLPCGLVVRGDDMYMVSGYSGQILRLDAEGRVLAAVGRSGEGIGEFGEAHYIAVGLANEIYVADPVGRQVEKFVPR